MSINLQRELTNLLNKLEYIGYDKIVEDYEKQLDNMEYVFEELLGDNYNHIGCDIREYKRANVWNKIGMWDKELLFSKMNKYTSEQLYAMIYICKEMINYNKRSKKRRCDNCRMKINTYYYNVISCEYCFKLYKPITKKRVYKKKSRNLKYICDKYIDKNELMNLYGNI